jgi:hypothetical protein
MSNDVVPIEKAGELQEPAPTAVNLFNAASPKEVVVKSAEVAKALADIILKQKLYTVISERKHVRVEGWTLCGSMLGVYPVCTWTRPIENGWEARVEAKTMNGTIVGAAEASCLRTEKLWSSRDDFALRSMAQTRATSRALRMPLGFIIQLAGYDATPAEEAEGGNTLNQSAEVSELNQAVKGKRDGKLI